MIPAFPWSGYMKIYGLTIYTQTQNLSYIRPTFLICKFLGQNSTQLFLQRQNCAVSMSVCVYSNSPNDDPRVAQRYGTIAAHTRRRASVPVVFVVFCMHMYSFVGLPFSNTAIKNRHSDTTIFQLRAHWVRISWSIGSEKSFGHVPPVGVEPSTSCVQGEHPIH